MNPPLPWISLLLLSPLAGAALLCLLPGLSRQVAFLSTLVSLGLSLAIAALFDPAQGGFQFIEQAPWIPTLNIHYRVGVDGLSLFFLPLASLLWMGVIVSSWNAIQDMPRLYYSLLLLLLGMTLGVFCALDTILFFLFWELTLIPIYFLVSLWGSGPNRRYAAAKYTLFMLASGVPLILGLVLLSMDQALLPGVSADLSFDYLQLLTTPVSVQNQYTLFFLLLLGFSAKVPLFPLHTWLPTMAIEGNVGLTAVLTGLKLGAYGLIRFLLPLTPEVAVEFHLLLAGLGTIGLMYGAMLAMAQSNLRPMLAYASMSHVGLVVLGLSSFDVVGLQGSLLQLLNFTILSGGAFLLTGFLLQRTGSTERHDLGGVVQTMPLLTAFFLLLGMASLGMPGTNGFPAEFLILFSALGAHPGAGLAALATMVMAAAYVLTLFRTIFLGPVASRRVAECRDLRPRELAVAVVLALLVLLLGLFPGVILDNTESAARLWAERFPLRVNP